MTFFKRMFSADFRRAVAAEAAGDYAEAARAYALAGERVKVAEMHLLRAERAPSPAAKLHELRAAVRWAEPDDPDGKNARRRIARALFNWARASAVIGDPEKQVVRDAAQLFVDTGDFAAAGECLEFVGDEFAAAEAYQKGGDVERLENVLAREEHRRKRDTRIHDAFEEYKLALAAGERDRALEAIRLCAESPLPTGARSVTDRSEQMRERASYQRLREELEGKLIADGSVIIRAGAVGHTRERRYVGSFPLVMGRDAACQLALRDAGISRQHAHIVARDDGSFALCDRDSKNGTTLAGVRVAPGGELPLVGEGDIGLGELCVIHFQTAGQTLTLEVTRGLDRGLRLVAGRGELDVEGVGELMFIDGRPRLSPVGGRLLYLNGVHASAGIQLVRGDVVELGEQRLEVG